MKSSGTVLVASRYRRASSPSAVGASYAASRRSAPGYTRGTSYFFANARATVDFPLAAGPTTATRSGARPYTRDATSHRARPNPQAEDIGTTRGSRSAICSLNRAYRAGCGSYGRIAAYRGVV